MIEWIKMFGINVWQWFVENKDTITAFFMSGQAISFVAALVMLVKNLRGTKDNTKSSKTLNETLTNTNKMSDAITTLDGNFKSLKEENDGLRKELKEVEEKLQITNEEIKNKLNAIVDVQAIVYSTIRDDGVRQTVNTILNNARYSEKNFKQELEQKIEDLKQNYSEELAKVNEKMTKSMDDVIKQVSAVEEAKTVMEERTLMRY